MSDGVSEILFSNFGPSDSGHQFKMVRAASLQQAKEFLGILDNPFWHIEYATHRHDKDPELCDCPTLLWEFDYSNPNYEG